MARKPQVRYFESRNAFYCQLHGKQHKLADGPDDFPDGPNYLAALKAFFQLHELTAAPTAGDANTVRTICELYMQSIDGKVAPATLAQRQAACATLVEFHGSLTCAALKPSHIDEILTARSKPRTVRVGVGGKACRVFQWGQGGRRTFLSSIQVVFRWAVKHDYLPRSPLRTIEIPSPRSGARDAILSDDDHRVIASFCTANQYRSLRTIIAALEDTGARPGELMAADCRDFDRKQGVIIYYRNDVRREDEFRTKVAAYKDRIIYFTGSVLDAVRKTAERGPASAPLFTAHRGQRWTETALTGAFRRLRARSNLPLHLIPYTYRHTFATRFLLAGGSVDVLAGLLGNSAQTIRQHYAHLLHQHDAMRAHLHAFKAAERNDT